MRSLAQFFSYLGVVSCHFIGAGSTSMVGSGHCILFIIICTMIVNRNNRIRDDRVMIIKHVRNMHRRVRFLMMIIQILILMKDKYEFY